MEFTLGYCLERSALKFSDKTSIVYEKNRISYKELNRRTTFLANAFLKFGIKKGDKIASLLFNTPEVIEVYFAAAKIGAVNVPINFRLVDREVDYILSQSDSSILIYDISLREVVENASSASDLILISVGKKSYPDSTNYEKILSSSTDSKVSICVTENDLRFIMYTSGTTGSPKGAMFTHKNNLWAALSLIITKKYDFNETLFIVNPLFHMNSYINVIASIFMGNKIVLMKKFNATEMLKQIESEKVTICSIVPTICKRLLETCEDRDFDTSSWRYCTCTGSSWPFKMKKEFMTKFPHVVTADAYGATEVFSGTLIEGHEIIKRPQSVGKPYLDTLLKIVDKKGVELKAGKIGEIILFGPHVTKGYYKNREATKNALKNGWFYTGDRGYVDDDGYLYFVDREKDMIISGGENIYSAEIEKVLLLHEKITEAAVVGVPDNEWGEVVKAYIVLRNSVKMDKDEVITFCKQHLASYKKPHLVEFVDSLPKNTMGKILKKELRKR
jgi:acyl-CoA synthetase (AMP-forming)/AMP-acid ligase II